MSAIIEADENGTLQVPASLLPSAAPHARYRVEAEPSRIVLFPETSAQPFWESATPAQRAREFLRWANSHTDGIGLSDEAVSRDSIYD